MLSAVALWHLRLKSHSFHVFEARKGLGDPGAAVAFLAATDWAFLPLAAHRAAAELAHPLKHKDPFGKWLLVQEQAESMRLLARNSKLAGHPFAVAGRNTEFGRKSNDGFRSGNRRPDPSITIV